MNLTFNNPLETVTYSLEKNAKECNQILERTPSYLNQVKSLNFFLLCYYISFWLGSSLYDSSYNHRRRHKSLSAKKKTEFWGQRNQYLLWSFDQCPRAEYKTGDDNNLQLYSYSLQAYIPFCLVLNFNLAMYSSFLRPSLLHLSQSKS